MTKTIISTLFAATLISQSAFAHDECSINLQGHLYMTPQVIKITNKDGDKLAFQQNDTVLLNGKSIELNDTQRQLAHDYFVGIQALVPQGAAIAEEAIALAEIGVTKAFIAISGDDSEIPEKMSDAFADLRKEIHQTFYQGDAFHFNGRLDGDDGVMSTWEEKLSNNIEDLVQQSVGSLMMALGSQMLFGDGDMSDFEKRMENFEADLESSVEKRADVIEAKAEQLCLAAVDLDDIEKQLQQSLTAFHGLNMIETTLSPSRM